MRILNPNYVAPIDAKAAALKTKIATYFTNNPGVPFVTLAQVQAQFPADAAGVVQGALHQAAKDAGWLVQNDD